MKNLLIQPNSNIKNALKQMSETGEKCLIVVDKKNKLLGTLSDGDIRKAILNGKIHKDKISTYYQKRPTFLRKENEGAKTFFGAQNFQFPMLWADKSCVLP